MSLLSTRRLHQKISLTSGRFGRSSPRSKPVGKTAGKSRSNLCPKKSKDHKQNRFSHYFLSREFESSQIGDYSIILYILVVFDFWVWMMWLMNPMRLKGSKFSWFRNIHIDSILRVVYLMLGTSSKHIFQNGGE